MTVDIDIWIWPQTGSDGPVADAIAMLSADELDRARSFVRRDDGDRFATTRARTRQILSHYLSVPPTDLQLATSARNKPTLPGGPAFNLSHAGGLAVLAVVPGRSEAETPVGIDIEAHRPVEPRVAEISFSAAEQAEIATLTGQDWTDAFFRCWTRKEAVTKALGLGLYLDLGSFDVTTGAQEPARLTRIGPDSPPVKAWSLRHFELSPTMPGALACVSDGQPLNVTVRERPESLRPVFRF